MSRSSRDEYLGPRLWNGFDYDHQAWVKDGKYVRCGHPDSMNCHCFGKEFEGAYTQAPSSVFDDCIFHAGLNQIQKRSAR